MNRFGIVLLFIYLLTGNNVILVPQEIVTLNGSDGWKGCSTINTRFEKGYKGFSDIVLNDAEYVLDDSTDLLLHFNGPVFSDETGQYEVIRNSAYTDKNRRYGYAAALIDKNGGVQLKGNDGSLFSPDLVWDDFSIEFWLYPASLSENEIIFHWTGLFRSMGRILPQEIKCSVSERCLVWDFENFFFDVSGKTKRITLTGPPMLPREWHHYLIRFDSETGLLEYCIDGRPVSSSYTNRGNREEGEIFLPLIGADSDVLEIGSSYTGLLDELRISSRFIDDPNLDPFSGKGIVISDIIDLKNPDSVVKSIEGKITEPGRTMVYISVCTSNDRMELVRFRDSETNDNSVLFPTTLQWENIALGETLPGIKGRYLLIKAELYPDLSSSSPPRLSELTVNYIPQLPPYPPAGVTVTAPGDGSVLIKWRRPSGENIKGYMIFYGDKPGEYFKNEPVDAGNVMEYRFTQLEKRKLYFFSVVAYSGSDPPQYSPFSEEVNIRP